MNPQHHALGAPLELDTSRTPFLEDTLHLLLTEGQPPSLERGKTLWTPGANHPLNLQVSQPAPGSPTPGPI